MKTAFTLLAGVAIGALAIQGLHAQQTGGQQQMPKVIYVSEIDVSNPEGYGKEFAPKAQELIRKHGGRTLALGGIGVVLLKRIPSPASQVSRLSESTFKGGTALTS